MALQYCAPIEDMQFVLRDVLKLSGEDSPIKNAEISDDLIHAILEEMAKFSERVIHPLNTVGDREGVTLKNGEVITPTGFKDAYSAYCEGGWIGMTSSEAIGGQGLPHTLSTCVLEMNVAANPGFSMYTGMNKAAIMALKAGGNEELIQTYSPKLVSGEWAATMNLTEPQAGTDLGLLKTKAILQPDGSYRISGEKIFISGGDHDLTDNIIHLVLARTPNAPLGSKGLSLFLVPKFLIKPNGSQGPRNHVECTGVEKKMGLKGSATCSMHYEEAIGYLIGQENRGLQIMFSMMNIMRITVGGQAVGLADIAYQNARIYSKERLQGRAPNATTPPDQPTPLVQIPDVRRMLMASRSFIEASRAFVMWLGMQLDISERSEDTLSRQDASNMLALLTPVVKGYLTEVTEQTISMCLQCYGGHGYITETGIEQVYRDARISKIYEGATGVQAMDLLGRKVLQDGGQSLEAFLLQVQETVTECTTFTELTLYVDTLSSAISTLQSVTQWIFQNVRDDINLPGAVSHHYLNMLGLISCGYMWCLMALTARKQLEENTVNTNFLKNKIATGRFFMEQYMSDCDSLAKKIKSGSAAIMELSDDII